MKDLFISVVIPVSKFINMKEFLLDISKILRENYTNYEIIIIDSLINQQNKMEIEELLNSLDYIRYIMLSKQYNEDIRVFAGLDSAIGDFVVVINPETDPASIITDAVEKCRFNSGMVIGVSSKTSDGFFTKKVANLFYWYINRVLGLKIVRNTTGFLVLSRQVVNAIMQLREKNRDLRTISSIIGYSSELFEYETKGHRGRKFTLRLKEGLNLIISKSPHLLRIASILGAIAAGVNVIFVFYVILVNFFKENVVEGWTTTSLQSSFMFFIIFLILALISEYLYIILNELRDRPLYFIVEEKNSSVLFRGEKIENISKET